MSQYFPKLYEPFGRVISVRVDLSNYATKNDVKNISHVDARSFELKTNLVSLKTGANKLDVGKLTPVPNDLAQLSNVIKNDVVKKTQYDKSASKANNIDTNGFVSRTKYEKGASDLEKKISNIDKKIPDVSSLVRKTNFNAKVAEIEGKIPDVTGFATNSVLTAVENKMPDVTSLVTKTDFDTELKKICDRVNSNKSKHLLVENELKKLEKSDAVYFRGKNYFDGNDGKQNYLVFQHVKRYLETANKRIKSWRSKGLSDEKISSVIGYEYPNLRYHNSKINIKFDGSVLKQNKITRSGSIVGTILSID